MSLLSDVVDILNDMPGLKFATGNFETGCKNRLEQSDDYLVLLPKSTAVISMDDEPKIEIQSARLTIYTPADWTPLEAVLHRAFISAGLYVTAREYGGYVPEEKRHAYEIEISQYYPITPPNNETEQRGEER